MKINQSPRSEAGAAQSSSTITQLNRDEIKQAANGNWKFILTSLGIDAALLKKRHGPCPACGGEDRFRFDDKHGDGTWFCSHCKPGDGFELLANVHGWDFRKCLEEVHKVLGGYPLAVIRSHASVLSEPAEPNEDIEQYLNWLWSSSKVISNGSPVDLYLQSRKLGMKSYPEVLRWHEGLKYFDQEGNLVGIFPCMLAKIEDPAGRTVAIHRTYLTPEGKKAPVEKPKKQTKRLFDGATKGAAIKLFCPRDILCVAEGIETALACSRLLLCPSWSTISAVGMENLVVPASVEQVVIVADNDENGRGLQAARKLATRLQEEGKTTQVIMPDQVGQDMADILIQGTF